MQQPGAIGYVVINYDGKKSFIFNIQIGIPVKAFPEDKIPSV